ncbi:hypothetical protein DPMN_039170 [Dreissena polymorpha]|uniref:Uncharacterized protein n=1 Tax=Dreissena polymorpha TaxID=45954 RepID=A0A9D4MG19_DREPO|nr:hypothetical protein DPMN_039170 [Dreissena polymorpha]
MVLAMVDEVKHTAQPPGDALKTITWVKKHFALLREWYKLERQDRNSRGGGIAAFIRAEIPARRRRDLESKHLENILFEIPQVALYAPYALYALHAIRLYKLSELMFVV